MVLLCYAGLVLVVRDNSHNTNPISLIMFETGLLTVFAPMMLYGAIAGERERRSWDLLLAAPITKSQIVFGKFMGALAALSVAVLLFQVPILISALSFPETNWLKLLWATLMSFAFLLDVCALTILFSARVKRGLMALGAVLGILGITLVVIPSVFSAAGVDRVSSQVTMFLHPISVLYELGGNDRDRYSMVDQPTFVPLWLWGWPQTIVYALFAVLMLNWAAKTLTFAENEVKFLPQGNKNA